MLKIGITGGIGAGKSTVCRIFAALGIPVYDADTRARQLLAEDETLRQLITAYFGVESYLPNGQPNRPYLATAVFGQPERLQQLNSFIHPRVADDTRQWFARYEGQKPYVLKEAALLYEAGAWQELDKVIVVSAPLPLRINRVKQRDPARSEPEIEAIIARQMPQEEKVARADFVIYNDGQQLLIPQVLHLHGLLLAKARE